MKGLALILFLFFGTALLAQQHVQTIVPLQPIAVGSAFQVQYIVTDAEPAVELQSPAFGKDFRFVSGPRLYQGTALINNTKTPIQNFSYTLIPLRKGRLVIKGATLIFKSGKKRSGDAFVVVTDKSQDDSLASTPITNLPRLAQGSTWNAKLQEQLFIKAAVSKQSCFVGEPVVATFTLFSRLPSASEVIKNPGFYGFSVLELPDAADGGQTVQTHKGTFYNTHVLRHVQLYPMQAGAMQIDKMSVTNAIEYADSASGAPVQTTVLLESKPLTIAVKPLPEAPEAFSGAVGAFSIAAYLEKKEWQQNNNSKLMVTIKGAGNFLQLTAPEINWPKGTDVFEPTITERLQKEAVPVSGTRTYSYTFTADSLGQHSIPPIALTYFNPTEKKYKTIATDSLHFTVLEGTARTALPPAIRKQLSNPRSYIGLIAAALLLVVAIAFYKKYTALKKKRTVVIPAETEPDYETQIGTISPMERDAYRRLQQALMGFLKSLHPQVDVSQRSQLSRVAFKNTDAAQQVRLQKILDECEAVQYYNAAPTIPFTELQQQALAFIRSVNRS